MTTAPLSCFITPAQPALSAGQANTLSVLVRVQGGKPPADAPARHPLNLALVLDRSGSMSGAPLHEAKRCAAHIVKHLLPTDRLALVSYDNRVQVEVPNQPIGDGQPFFRAINGLRSGGSTALHAGWLAGGEQTATHQGRDWVNRVLLLSDGRANVGERDVDTIAAQAAQLADTGISTTTVGLGASFNEDLMIALAERGQGNHYYGETAEDLMEPFQTEFELLAALCARELTLRIETAPGVAVTLRNKYSVTGDRCWRLPDLAWQAEVWALFELTIPAALLPASPTETLALLRPVVTYRDAQGEISTVTGDWLELPALPASDLAGLPQASLVVRRGQELDAAQIQEQAARAAAREQWDEVDRCLAEARAAAADNPWAQASLQALAALSEQRDEVMFRKEARYKAAKMRKRQTEQDEVAAYSIDAQMDIPAYLRKKPSEGKRLTEEDKHPDA